MQFQKLRFKNAQGQTLSARLDLPIDEKPIAYGVFAHCFTCTKNFNAIVNINRALAMHGIAVLRFDFTGLGESEGDFPETNFSSNVSDLIAAAHFLEANFEAPKLLIGHSLGGAAILQAAGKIPSCRAVATISAPADPSDLARLLVSSAEEIRTRGEADITLAGRTFRIKKQFLEDLTGVRMQETVSTLDKPLLLFHSTHDQVTEHRNAREIFEWAKNPKSFISLDTADHLLSNRADSLYVGNLLAVWASRYIGLPQIDPYKKDLTDNRVVVRTGKVGYRTEIVANGHSLVADEPVAVGGSNTGPTPYEYLVAGLGACTAITLRMYADRKEWPLDAVTVRLKHEKIHAEDCKNCETKKMKIDHIEREIELSGPLDEIRRARLLEIADRCPVHRTLQGSVSIDSRLKD